MTFEITVTFASGKKDTFTSSRRDWIGCALGRNQAESLQTIKSVTVE